MYKRRSKKIYFDDIFKRKNCSICGAKFDSDGECKECKHEFEKKDYYGKRSF